MAQYKCHANCFHKAVKLCGRRFSTTHLPFPHMIPHPAKKKKNSRQCVCVYVCEWTANYTRLHLNVWLKWRLELNSNSHQGVSASVESHWLSFFSLLLPPPCASSVFSVFYSIAASCLKPSVTFQARKKRLLLWLLLLERHTEKKGDEKEGKKLFSPEGTDEGPRWRKQVRLYSLFSICTSCFSLVTSHNDVSGTKKKNKKRVKRKKKKEKKEKAALSWRAFSNWAAVKLLLMQKKKIL